MKMKLKMYLMIELVGLQVISHSIKIYHLIKLQNAQIEHCQQRETKNQNKIKIRIK